MAFSVRITFGTTAQRIVYQPTGECWAWVGTVWRASWLDRWIWCRDVSARATRAVERRRSSRCSRRSTPRRQVASAALSRRSQTPAVSSPVIGTGSSHFSTSHQPSSSTSTLSGRNWNERTFANSIEQPATPPWLFCHFGAIIDVCPDLITDILTYLLTYLLSSVH